MDTTDQGSAAGPSAEAAAKLEELTRAYADLLNDREEFRRRLSRERDRQLEAQRGEVATALLDTLDELERALAGGGGEALVEGLRLVTGNLRRRLAALGLEPIPTRGHLFDPAVHDAVDLAPTPDAAADGTIVGTLREGFRLGERVIRPARVRVARHVPAGEGPPVPAAAAGPLPAEGEPTSEGEPGAAGE